MEARICMVKKVANTPNLVLWRPVVDGDIAEIDRKEFGQKVLTGFQGGHICIAENINMYKA